MAGAPWHDADPRPPYDREPDPDPGSFRRDQEAAVPGARDRRAQDPTAQDRSAQDRGAQDRGARGRARRRRARPRRAAQWWGTRPGRLGVLVVCGCAAVGMVVTIAARSEPGLVLGGFVVAGTIIAALAVRPGAVHVIIPVPALAYLVAGSVAGLIHDRAADTSRTGLITSATQWFGGGFLAMTAATVVAIAITAARRPRARRGRRQRSS